MKYNKQGLDRLVNQLYMPVEMERLRQAGLTYHILAKVFDSIFNPDSKTRFKPLTGKMYSKVRSKRFFTTKKYYEMRNNLYLFEKLKYSEQGIKLLDKLKLKEIKPLNYETLMKKSQAILGDLEKLDLKKIEYEKHQTILKQKGRKNKYYELFHYKIHEIEDSIRNGIEIECNPEVQYDRFCKYFGIRTSKHYKTFEEIGEEIGITGAAARNPVGKLRKVIEPFPYIDTRPKYELGNRLRKEVYDRCIDMISPPVEWVC